MSHFSVAVIHEENQCIDDLLAPYDENIELAPHVEFSRQEAIDFAQKHYAKLQGATDEECWDFMAENRVTDKEGNIYTTANDYAKWDYWVEGGRWEGFLKLKGSNKHVSSAKIKDVDFSPDERVYKESLRFWDLVVENKPLEPGEEEPFNIYKPEYYHAFYNDREDYARRQAQFYTAAVITPDGLWNAPGEYGWFGSTTKTPESARNWHENYFKDFIEGNEDLYITIVDCHI